jgi:hypothetical protein
MRAIWAFNFIETANPALSSAGEVIFEPEDKRARDLLNMALDCPSNVALDCADVFVFMTITDSFHESPLAGFCITRHPCREAGLYIGALPIFPPAVCGRQTPFSNGSVSAGYADTLTVKLV